MATVSVGVNPLKERSSPSCPLCAGQISRRSWLGTLRFEEQDYPYLECVACRSLYAEKMPDEPTLARMYGTAYEVEVSGGEGVCDPKDPNSVISFLAQLPRGTFIDYGCGDGKLLRKVASLGWRVLGVEFDREVAGRTTRTTGIYVHDRSSLGSLDDGAADVLHLGDVVEHLTAPAEELRRVLRLVKQGGYVVSQGPLEANSNLFTGALRTWKWVTRKSVSNMAPYHVLLATKLGQEALFNRVGLQQKRFTITEVDWPAPSRLNLADLFNSRQVALFLLRRASRALSAFRASTSGNRYFYVGQRP